MSDTSNLTQHLDTILRDAERAALRVDRAAMEQAAGEIDRWYEALRLAPPPAAELQEIRARLAHYRDLCQFVGDTLHEALTAACETAAGAACYAGNGKLSEGAEPALLKRYG